MRLHIVKPYNSIAMTRLCEPLKALSNLYEVTLGETPDNAADINVHIPWHTLINHEGGRHVIAYTHCNPGDEAALLQACGKAELITAMSFTGRRELLNYGVDPKKIHVIPCSADFSLRRRIVLVVGSVQPNGRKRESLLLDIAWQYDVSLFEFIFVGTGWESTVEKLHALHVAARIIEPKDDNELKNLYYTADVLLVTGYLEGGSLPILEAMAAGTNILSPAFGYAADYLTDKELYTDTTDLYGKLMRHQKHRLRNHNMIQVWQWSNYAMEYALQIGRLLHHDVDLFPEYGMSRYAQLLDIIDEIKPKRIVEIGTWNGNNAIRMLQQAGRYHKEIKYTGYDLFDAMTGEQFTRELSKKAQPLRVIEKRLKATGATIELIPGDTNETLEGGALSKFDLCFVDGGHSEATIDNDGWAALLNESGVIVFDDYYYAGKPDGMGCNKLINELDRDQWAVTHLPVHTRARDGREIGMVKVCPHMYMAVAMDTAKK